MDVALVAGLESGAVKVGMGFYVASDDSRHLQPSNIPDGAERAYICIDANRVGEYNLSLSLMTVLRIPSSTRYTSKTLGEDECDW